MEPKPYEGQKRSRENDSDSLALGLSSGVNRSSHLNFHPEFSKSGALKGVRVVGVFGDALKESLRWSAQKYVVPTLSLEIGRDEITDLDFVAKMRDLLRDTGTKGESIELLMAEENVISNPNDAIRTILKLRELVVPCGIRGFTLLEGARLDLRSLSLSSLRVNAAALFHATSAVESLWLARTVISIARRGCIRLVAEGVETEEQRVILLAGGCEYLSGPLFGRELNSNEFEVLMSRG